MSISQEAESLKRRWQEFYESVAKPQRCIFCQGKRIVWNGRRVRSASVSIHGEVAYINEVACRRVKCAVPQCSKSWTLRPPGLAPQRHFQLCVVAHATSSYLHDPRASRQQVAQRHGCSRRTVGRWLHWLAGIARPADLQRHLLEASGHPLLPEMPEVAELLRKARSSARRALLQRAAQVLALIEALGQALRLEPPGLRAVVEATLADRYQVTTYRCPSIPELARRHRPPTRGTLPM